MIRCNLRRVVMPTVGGMCIGIVIVNFVVHWKQFGYGLDELDVYKVFDKVDLTVDYNGESNHTNSILSGKTREQMNGKFQGNIYINLVMSAKKSETKIPQINLTTFNIDLNQKVRNRSSTDSAVTVLKQTRNLQQPVIIENKSIVRQDGRENSSKTIWPTYDANGTFIGDDRILAQLRFRALPPSTKSKRRKVKIIYIPSGLGDLPAGRAKFQTDRCPVNTCSLTPDSRYEHTADLRMLQADAYYDAPPKKPRGQIWLLWLLESPLNTIAFPHLKHLVNWTATYRTDSTLVTPYEKYVPYDVDDADFDNLINVTSLTTESQLSIESKINGSSNYDVRNDDVYVKLGNASVRDGNRRDGTNYAAGKTRMVAWFVSNCGANNRRWEYMQELRRHVPVDVYGDCSGAGYQCARTEQKTCDRLLSRDYKFYLSFENSNCQYYITEKFFRNALWYEMCFNAFS